MPRDSFFMIKLDSPLDNYEHLPSVATVTMGLPREAVSGFVSQFACVCMMYGDCVNDPLRDRGEPVRVARCPETGLSVFIFKADNNGTTYMGTFCASTDAMSALLKRVGGISWEGSDGWELVARATRRGAQ